MHTVRFSLVPVIHSAIVATGHVSDARELLTTVLPAATDSEAHIQPQNGVAAAALAGLDDSDALLAAIGQSIEAFPVYHGQRGVEAQWQLLNGRPQAALQSLSDALDKGWLLHWWMLPQSPVLREITDTAEFQALLERMKAYARNEALKLEDLKR